MAEEKEKMIFDDEARKDFYKELLEAGVFFLQNGDIFSSNLQSKEELKMLQNATFPENAVTVEGKH